MVAVRFDEINLHMFAFPLVLHGGPYFFCRFFLYQFFFFWLLGFDGLWPLLRLFVAFGGFCFLNQHQP